MNGTEYKYYMHSSLCLIVLNRTSQFENIHDRFELLCMGKNIHINMDSYIFFCSHSIFIFNFIYSESRKVVKLMIYFIMTQIQKEEII
jgi:hypothetical protein